VRATTNIFTCTTGGWDRITTEPGAYEHLPCPVCGSRMRVERDAPLITGWAHAIAVFNGFLQPRRRDVFTCEYVTCPWHREALSLRRRAVTTCFPDQAIRLDAEANALVRENVGGERGDTTAEGHGLGTA
jgi:hypothetical protein